MKWKTFGKLGLSIAGMLIPQVHAIEEAAKVLKQHPTGAEKQAAVMAMVKASLGAAESLADRDLLDDAEVVAASQAVIDATVHLNNVVERARAKRAEQPAA